MVLGLNPELQRRFSSTTVASSWYLLAYSPEPSIVQAEQRNCDADKEHRPYEGQHDNRDSERNPWKQLCTASLEQFDPRRGTDHVDENCRATRNQESRLQIDAQKIRHGQSDHSQTSQ